MSRRRIQARATINLAGVTAGSVVRVDPEDPYMAACIAAGFLVPTRPSQVPPAAAEPVEAAADTEADGA